MEIVLLSCFIPFSSTTLESSGPIIWGLAVSLVVVSCGTPNVPVSIFVIFGGTRLTKPLVLVTGVIDLEIHDKFHSTTIQVLDQPIDILKTAIPRGSITL